MERETKIKKEVIKPVELTEKFVLTWQYINHYVSELIFRVELFKKVVDGTATAPERYSWNNIFYIKKKGKFTIVPDVMSDEEIKEDYNLYRDFVMSELKRCMPFMEMYLYEGRMQAQTIDETIKRTRKTFNTEEYFGG